MHILNQAGDAVKFPFAQIHDGVKPHEHVPPTDFLETSSCCIAVFSSRCSRGAESSFGNVRWKSHPRSACQSGGC